MLISFTIIIVAIIIYFLHKQLLKIDQEREDEKYIHGLLKEYSVNDAADMVRLTQGLRDVQRIIEDKNITNVSLNMSSLSDLWTNHDNPKTVVANQDGQSFWVKFLNENLNLIDTEKPYNHQVLNEFFNEIKEIVIDMPNRVSDDNILELIKYDVLTIVWLLELLDKRGDCPSVVKVTNDNDASYKNDYDILSQYTLLDHSIRVAHQVMALLKKEDTGYFILLPTIIAALGHDIGKIPDFVSKESYTKSQHPATSITILRKSRFFKLIPEVRKNLIDKAISEHHNVFKDKEKNSNPILIKLKEADQRARREEMALNEDNNKGICDADINDGIIVELELKEPTAPNEQQETKSQEKEAQETNNSEEKTIEHSEESAKPEDQSESDTKIKSFAGNKSNDIAVEDIPVVNEEFLTELMRAIKAKINIVEKYAEDKYKFNAFTFKNSVYVTPFFLTNTLTNLFNEFGDHETANVMIKEDEEKRQDSVNKDKPYTRAVLLYILERLRDSGFVSTEAFRPGFVGGYFDIYNSSSIILHLKAYYTVLKIDMFVENGDTVESTIQELEKRKRIGDNNYLLKFYSIIIHK